MVLHDAWKYYLRSQQRPDSGESVLRQYKFQWDAFVARMAAKQPTSPALCDVNPDITEEYVAHLQESGLANGTINKHVRLLKLVFKVLGPGENIDRNPFDRINSKREIQEHREEISWDMLCKVFDAVDGEMKLLFFLGIYTGQRLADFCLLTWDQVDLMRVPGWIHRDPKKDRQS